MDPVEWFNRYRAFMEANRPVAPRVVKVSGETDEPDQSQTSLGDFAALTADQWHRAILVRSFIEKHPERWG